MSKNKHRINKRGKITIYSFILLLIVSIYICISSSIFELKEINVNGNEKLSKKDIVDISSLKLGNNLFKYNIDDIEKSILKNPYVKDVKVKRKIPDKLVIDIEENTEDAIVKLGGKYLYIQQDGLILSEKTEVTNKNIPIISGVELKEKSPKTNIEIVGDTKQNLLISLLNCLKSNNMLREIEAINVKKNDIKMKTNDNVEIELKLDDNLDYNIKKLRQILVDLKSNNIRNGTIDLTNKEQAVYSP